MKCAGPYGEGGRERGRERGAIAIGNKRRERGREGREGERGNSNRQ